MLQLDTIKKRKIIRDSLFILAVAILLINMNKIIYVFFEDSMKLHKVEFDDYNINSPAYTFLNKLEYQKDNIQEIIGFTGWAFAETTEPNDSRSVYLILKGEKNTYMTGKCVNAGGSIHKIFPDWKNIYGTKYDFALNVSTLILPSDTYEIYVYVEENELNKGIVSTGRSFKKDGVKLYSYSLGEIVDDIDPEQINHIFDYGWIDNLSNENGCIEVAGWQAIENKNSENSIYYLVFIGDNQEKVTIQIPSICRVDVGSYLGSQDYIISGFRGALDKKNLPDETGIVYVVAENDGELYRTESYSYDINETEAK